MLCITKKKKKHEHKMQRCVYEAVIELYRDDDSLIRNRTGIIMYVTQCQCRANITCKNQKKKKSRNLLFLCKLI